MSEKILTVDEAAKFLKVSTGAVQTLLESRELAGRRIEGQWRTTRRAVLLYVDGGIGEMACCPCPPAGVASACCSGEPGCC